MFFECVVATKLWDMISQAAGVVVGGSFENFDARWLCNKRFLVINMIALQPCGLCGKREITCVFKMCSGEI
jgi:hypothetical protein